MDITKKDILNFQKVVLAYYHENYREFAWRQTFDPYEILVSEFMLQQTQTARVVPFYERFLSSFPTFFDLAEAPVSSVLAHWQGLGYNRRALNLQKTACQVVNIHKGVLPQSVEELCKLPGIGAYTAQAIRSFAFGLPGVLIETNVRAVYIHHFFPEVSPVSDKLLIPLIEKTLYQKDTRTWYYALMDYGVSIKARYRGIGKRSAHYSRQSPFQGSHRQLRGAILRELTQVEKITPQKLSAAVKGSPDVVKACLSELFAEGFLRKIGRSFALAQKLEEVR